jgi:hypothetical protein
MWTFIKASAWELGERFEAILTPRFGPEWKDNAAAGRARPKDRHDADFVLYAHPQDSILWEALPPRSADLLAKFDKARWTRNLWEHETATRTTNHFHTGVDRIVDLGATLGLEARMYGPALKAHVAALQRNGGRLPPSDEVVAALAKLDEAEALRREAEEIAELLAQQASLQGHRADEAEIERLNAQRSATAAQLEIERLEEHLRAAEKQQRISLLEPADDLAPGDPWGSIPIPTRTLSLLGPMRDLLDQQAEVLLSEELGDVATSAASRWLTWMPRGGPVHITLAGHATGKVGARYIYLGRLDEG